MEFTWPLKWKLGAVEVGRCRLEPVCHHRVHDHHITSNRVSTSQTCVSWCPVVPYLTNTTNPSIIIRPQLCVRPTCPRQLRSWVGSFVCCFRDPHLLSMCPSWSRYYYNHFFVSKSRPFKGKECKSRSCLFIFIFFFKENITRTSLEI